MYDVANPRRPHHIATFANGSSAPEPAQTWTEKTIVRRVTTEGFDGVLAVTSVQACANGFGGFALYDVTNPARPLRLALVLTEPRDSHEIWLATARGHVWVYTALAATEFAVEPNQFGFHIYDPAHLRYLGRTSAGRGTFTRRGSRPAVGSCSRRTKSRTGRRSFGMSPGLPAPAGSPPYPCRPGCDPAGATAGASTWPTAFLCPGASCTAVWGVFPMRGYVLASELNSGLWVLRVRR